MKKPAFYIHLIHLKSELTHYLDSPQAFAGKKRSIISSMILIVWLLFVIFISLQHEFERDEVRALSLALEPDALWNLPAQLKNEGHPVLWYLILRIGSLIFPSPLILQVASISIAFGSVAIFYKYSPFPIWQKILFICGVFPIYHFSVLARNYGLSMLLFFLFAMLYPQRNKHPFLLAGVLILLANANMHSCVLVCVITALWFFEDFVLARRSLNFHTTVILSCSFSLIGMGIWGAVVTTLPDQDTIVTNALSFDTSQTLKALWENIKHPGMPYLYLHTISESISDLVSWGLVAGLLISPLIAVSLYMGMVLLGLFYTIVYPASVNHHGVFIMFLISLYWIVCKKTAFPVKGNGRPFLLTLFHFSLYRVLTLIFIFNIIYGCLLIRYDVSQELSSSRSLGEFLNTNSQYQEAIILGEPDYYLESLRYYAPNLAFLAREGQFGNYVKFTRANKQHLSLGELLRVAKDIKHREGKPVLIALGHFDLSKQSPPLERHFSYNKLFTWSTEELKDFNNATVKVVEFKTALFDEKYEIYVLR